MAGEAPLIDREVLGSLMEAFADDPDGGLDELMAAFFEHMPPRIEALGQAMDQGDRQAIKSLAHSLKGSCANFGAARVAGKCAELEQSLGLHSGSGGFAPEIIELVADIRTLYRRTEIELRATIDQNI